ncbi:MAG: hypothetical protein D6784_11365 [Chloroflexi bacterium]|nr:MAG: hypothetical protein D6784_11365 [Chloroflexota bacterium]
MPLPLARPDYSGAASRRETRQWREAGASTGKADHQDVVQRVPAENTLPSPVSDAGKRIVQRAVDQPSMPGAEEKQNRPDLDALARQVYPLVKRLLSVERERWPF